MTIKKIVLVLLAISLAFCFVGCAKDDKNPTNPEETPTESTQDNSPSLPFVDEDDAVIVVGEQELWEAEKKEIGVDTIKLDAKWNENISIGDAVVSAKSFTDFSVIPNYYYGKGDSYATLEAAYHTAGEVISLRTNAIDVDEYVSVDLNIDGKAWSEEDRNYVAVEGIRLIATANIYEGGLETLKDLATYVPGDSFGVGSTYSHINNIIGEPTNSFSDRAADGTNLTTCVYISDDVEMILSYCWFEKDGIESAVLTSIDWMPTTVRDALSAQN